MTRHLQVLSITCIASSLFLAACAPKEQAASPPVEPQLAVSCIGVMPTRTMIDYESAHSPSQVKQLKDGAQVADILLRKQFGGKDGYRFVTRAQQDVIESDGESTAASAMSAMGEQLGCNLMLEVTLERYRDRSGGDYTSKEPASVAFQYKLTEVNQGRLLCQGRFEEKQQSLLENLYNWKRASKRGFTWVTAEELLEEGMEEKFSRCSFLRGE